MSVWPAGSVFFGSIHEIGQEIGQEAGAFCVLVNKTAKAKAPSLLDRSNFVATFIVTPTRNSDQNTNLPANCHWRAIKRCEVTVPNPGAFTVRPGKL